MRSLEDLSKEERDLNLEIRKLLLNKNTFREGLSDKIEVVTKISILRDRIMKIQREIRERTPDDEFQG